jgi:hypothetical protein
VHHDDGTQFVTERAALDLKAARRPATIPWRRRAPSEP